MITATYEELQNEIKQLKEQLQNLNEQIEWFKRQIFGKKSEKYVDRTNGEQLYFEGFDKLAKEPPQKKQTIPAHERKKRQATGQDKVTLPEDLPIEKQVLDIPEDEKICSETGEPLVKIGDEITQKY